MFELDEIKRRNNLPKDDPEHLRLPRIVELKDCRKGIPMGSMPWDTAVMKFG